MNDIAVDLGSQLVDLILDELTILVLLFESKL